MSQHVAVATHSGTLKIGDAEIPCVVLDDKRRVLTQLGVLRAIGRGRPTGGASQGTTSEGTPRFLGLREPETVYLQ